MSQTSDARGLTIGNFGNNRTSTDYEEAAVPDPDLEARLYAEIYYSNESYQLDSESAAAATTNLQNRVEPTAANFVVDSNRGAGEAAERSSATQPFYPSRSWVLGERRGDANETRPVRRQRALAYKGLWTRRGETEAQRDGQEFQSERRSGGAPGSTPVATGPEETSGYSGSPGSHQEPGIPEAFGNKDVTFGAFGGRHKNSVFGAFGGRNVPEDFASVVNRTNAFTKSSDGPGNVFAQFLGVDNDAEKYGSAANRYRRSRSDRFSRRTLEAENIGPAENRSEAGHNFSGFADEFIESENSERVVNPFHEPANNFIRLGGDGGRRFNRSREDSSWFGGEAIEAGNIPRNTADRRRKAAEYSTSFVDGGVEDEYFDDGVTNSYADNADPPDEAVIFDCSRYLKKRLTRSQREQLVKRLKKRQSNRERRKLQKEKKMRPKRPKNPEASVEQSTSKYKVVSKQNKLDEQLNRANEPEPVDISSDSDDSILEVPVPPKTPPPVIQLQDSDDEGEKTRQSPSKNRQKSAGEPSGSSPAKNRQKSAAEPSGSSPSKNRHKSAAEPSASSVSKNREKSAAEPSSSPASKNREKSAGEPSGSSSASKNREKSAGETSEESAASTSSETDSSEQETCAPRSSAIDVPISPKITQEAAKKSRIRPRNRESRKSKKSADESREDVSRGSEADIPAGDDSAAQIGEIGTPISPRIGRTPAKDATNAKNKKSADATNELASGAAETDCSADHGEARLQKILRDAAKKTRDTTISLPITCPEDGNLILNCTEIQKGASSLDEIRKMREMALPISHAHSDDSMTESEANNWVNIAAGQAKNSSRIDEEICSIGSSIEPASSALWEDQSSARENIRESSADLSAEKPAQSSTPIASRAARTIGDESENPRKRQTDSRPFEDFDVPAIPEKRTRQNRQKTSREQTMTEYFFKPMSREMQAYYNNSWGGENLDVYDIQSRMPRNPNHWAILDADLQGPTSRRRKTCPRCKTDSHYGKRCPEKAKGPCCYMCGAQGHTETRCPHTMCLTCGRKYATYRPTCGFCSQLYCTLCNGAGHSCENCPDLWRRYHNTTTDTLPMIPRDTASVMKPAQSLTCCNCARRGHDATTCRQLRWSQHFPTPTYVTSYTEGPTYDPGTPSQIGADRRYTHFAEESPPSNQFANRAAYNPPTDDFTRDVDIRECVEPRESIEIISIPDNVATPSQPKKMPAQRRSIFHAGQPNDQKTSGWPGIVARRLDQYPKIELTGLRAGTHAPNFLVDWQKNFPFCLEIYEDKGVIFITVRCRVRGILKELERVVWQWLERSDAEKAYLAYDKIPFRADEPSYKDLREKLILLRTVLSPLVLLKKIKTCDRTVQRTNANIQAKTSEKCSAATPRTRRRVTAVNKFMSSSMGRRCQLVTSLYSGAWVDGGDKMIASFKALARERLRIAIIGKALTAADYLKLVYLYNEIFTFHVTEPLKRALERVVAETPPEESALEPGDGAFPQAEIVFEGAEISATSQPENSAGSAATDSSNLANSEGHLENPTASTSQELDYLPINFGGNPPLDEQPQFPQESGVPDESADVDATTAQRQPWRLKDKPMMDLSKKQRKKRKNVAKVAIKVALASGSQRVQAMARALQRSMKDGTLKSSEIVELEVALDANVRTRKVKETVVADVVMKRKKQQRKSALQRQLRNATKPFAGTTYHVDPTYVDFLRTL